MRENEGEIERIESQRGEEDATKKATRETDSYGREWERDGTRRWN